MKKLLILLLTVVNYSVAQNKIAGDWEGKLALTGGINLRIIFHITDTDGQLSAKMDSPDQGVNGLACDKAELNNETLVIGLSRAGVVYEGTVSKDMNSITGTWRQGNASLNLDFLRKEVNAKEEVKPQTPLPPFSYASEDIEYDNETKTIHYGATLTYPKTGGNFPAVILITGSGLQDRDETIGLHKPFAVIADHLTKNGFAVLRVDDRGKGKTTGDVKNATTADFANDLEVAIQQLKSRKEINSKKIGLIGHSEGGMIAPLVASRNKSVAFIVLLAGPGIPIPELLAEQSEAMMKIAGVNGEALSAYHDMYKKEIVAIPNATTKEAAVQSAVSIFRTWQKATPKEIVVKTTTVTDSTSTSAFINNLVNQFYSPWFRYFLLFDPQPILQKLTCPVLALNGEKDVQVLAKSNLAGIKSALQKSKSTFEVRELPGLNHLFQTCSTCAPSEYFGLQETFSPTALDAITDWLKKTVK
ncbi:alpha/beta hydrolase [Cytophagales bacterium WSM2-2]|nr:alpha/beta hydrolase [Cytophagales bacterium WSM2-2]